MGAAPGVMALAVLLLSAASSCEAQEEYYELGDDPIATGCPILAREELEVVLELEGEGDWHLTKHLQTAIREGLAMLLLPAGVPDERYIGIKWTSSLCPKGSMDMPLQLLQKTTCRELALAVFIPDLARVKDVEQVVQGPAFCAVTQRAMHSGGDVDVICEVGSVVTTVAQGLSQQRESCSWGMPVEGIFSLGVFAGVVASIMVANLMWLVSHRTTRAKLRSHVPGKKDLACKVPNGQLELQVKATRPSFTIMRGCDTGPPHVPLEEVLSCSGSDGSRDTPDDTSTEHFQAVMVEEVGLQAKEKSAEPIVMSMYFEEVLPNSMDKEPQRPATIKTRILHKKYKVQEADLAQDGSNMDPITLLSLGSKFLFMIDIRRDKNSIGEFPFASVDHVVLVLQDGLPQMLRLVTLSSSGSGSSKGSNRSCWHRVAALWDPTQHASQSLAKVTPDGASVALDVTVVFRVFGASGGLFYVKKTMNVRVRDGGEARQSDAQYFRHCLGSRLPDWAKMYVKGSTVVMHASENSTGLIVDQTN